MSASDHLNGEQLKMFMSPNEILAEGYKPSEGLALKRKEAATWGITRSVAAEGVHHPVSLSHSVGWGVRDESGARDARSDKRIANGHHRFVAQQEADPDRLMPVVHGELLSSTQRAGFGLEETAAKKNPDLPSQYHRVYATRAAARPYSAHRW